MPLLQVHNLHVHFATPQGRLTAVRGINFAVQAQQTVALVGESGSGKSATAAALMGLLPSGATAEGEVLFNGRSLLTLPEQQKRALRGKEIGMIFQDPMTSLNPTMRIGAQIMESIHLHLKLSKAEAYSYMLEQLHAVGIADPHLRAAQYPHALSGGLRQRVLIAMALVTRPHLLIADEPTTALDVTVQAQILELLKELQAKMGMSILFITHDLAVVAQYCDHVLVLYGGHLVEQAPTARLFSSAAHPYTQGLLACSPHLNQDKHRPLLPIPGAPPSLHALPPGCPFAPRCPHARNICLRTPPTSTLQPEHTSACWLHTGSPS